MNIEKEVAITARIQNLEFLNSYNHVDFVYKEYHVFGSLNIYIRSCIISIPKTIDFCNIQIFSFCEYTIIIRHVERNLL